MILLIFFYATRVDLYNFYLKLHNLIPPRAHGITLCALFCTVTEDKFRHIMIAKLATNTCIFYFTISDNCVFVNIAVSIEVKNVFQFKVSQGEIFQIFVVYFLFFAVFSFSVLL